MSNTTETKCHPCLRKDFIKKSVVRIEGIYGWGSGYISKEIEVLFNTYVYSFCLLNGIDFTPSEDMSGPMSDNANMYGYFMGMEVVFRTTDKSPVDANYWATEFAEHITAMQRDIDMNLFDGVKPIKITTKVTDQVV